MGEIKEKLTFLRPRSWQSWAAILWFMVLAVVHFYLMARHSFWRDELEAWVTVAGMNSFWDNLFVPMHPPLWYMLLYVAHMVWPDPQMLAVVGSGIALGCFALLMAMTRISLLLRVLLSLNFYFLWQYTVVVRGYGLLLLLLLFWLSLKEEQADKGNRSLLQILHGLVLALIALVHVYGVVLVPVLYVWRYGIKFSPWRIIPAAGGCVAAVFLVWWSYPHLISPTLSSGADGYMAQVIEVALVLLKPLFPALTIIVPNYVLPFLSGLVLLCLTWLFYTSYKHTAGQGSRLLWGLRVVSVPIGLLALAVVIKLGSAALWHIGFIWLALVALLCLCQQHGREIKTDKAIHVAALLMSLLSLPFMLNVIHVPYSSAYQAAQQIKKMELDNQPWIAIPSWAGTAPFAYLQRPYFALETMSTITYTDWQVYWQREQQLGPASMAGRMDNFCVYARSHQLEQVNMVAPYRLFRHKIEPEMVRLGLQANLLWQSPKVLADDEDVSLFSVNVTACHAQRDGDRE